jgi:hypothetical protein
MSNFENDAKNRIAELITKWEQIKNKWRPILPSRHDDWRVFSEEDTKLKLIFPLFEALGWNFEDPAQTETESCKEYDESVAKEFHDKHPEDKRTSLQVDSILKNGEKLHVIIQAKRLSLEGKFPPMPGTSLCDLAVAYSAKWKTKYLVFTNFSKMLIIKFEYKQTTGEAESKVVANYQDPYEYLNQFKILQLLINPRL